MVFLTVFISFFVILATPLWDIDLWWHLATGKYIVEHKTLLSSDPFTYTSAGGSSYRMPLLNAYWFAQVIFYFAYTAFNNYGLIAIRVILLLSILFTIFFIGRKIGARDSCIVIPLILAGFTSQHFTGERPQLFSFLLAPIVFYLLYDLKKRYTTSAITIKSFVLLPLTMVLWANLHGGFIIGTALITLFGISEAIRLFLKKEQINKSFIMACIIMIVAIFASFLNPNTYKPYILLITMQGSILQQKTSEYIPPLTLMLKHKTFLTPYWIYLLFCFTVLGLSFKIVDKTHLVIILFLTAISLTSFRYIPFLIYITGPFVALYLSKIIEAKSKLKIILNILIPLLVLSTVIFAFKGYEKSLGRTFEHELRKYRFPEKAASFIIENRPHGNIFNHFNWGGYLIWRLYPEYKVFIDGRTLSMKTFSDYTYMLWDKNKGEQLLNNYDINVIIMPGLNPFTGELYELVNNLYEDKYWYLVYWDNTAMIFLRDNENRNLIYSFSLPKIEIYTHVIKQGNELLKSQMNNYHVWAALYKAYMMKGMNDHAKNAKRIATSILMQRRK